MYIIHYSLGFPPYRIGGLIKFCMDLMTYQQENGNRVALLWPGEMIGKKEKIRHTKNMGFDSFELINPLPVSICNGIQNDREFTRKYDEDVFEKFLEKEKPDIIHVHTLEGLPVEFLRVAKVKKIKLIYSTHDLFGICPTNDMFRITKVCDTNCVDCSECNQNAFSLGKIKVMQSFAYRKLKNIALMKYLRKKIRKDAKNGESVKHRDFQCDYVNLKRYYLECFSLFDVIHCNSNVTYKIFSKVVDTSSLKMVNITQRTLKDNRKQRTNKIKTTINFLYIGVEVINKGFYFLIDILDSIYKVRDDFRLIVYSQDDYVKRDYMVKHDTYSYEELSQIYADVDVLLVPSLRYETFGFVTLEAYYYGVPVLVTDTVGSKDIIINDVTGFVASKCDYQSKILELLENKKKIYEVSENIKSFNLDIPYNEMVEKIYQK